MKLHLIVVILLAFIAGGCANTAEKADWREAIKQEMAKGEVPDVRYSPEYITKTALDSLKPSFEAVEGGNYFKMVLKGVFLVPEDEPEKASFPAVKLRLGSALKLKATKNRNQWLEVIDVVDNEAIRLVPNFAKRFGAPTVEKFWGIGQGFKGEPGHLMIDPNDPFTAYRTKFFGGYKTKSGDRADLNKLCIAVVMYPDGRILPLREVLKAKGINKTDLEAGPHPELDIPLVPAAPLPQKK